MLVKCIGYGLAVVAGWFGWQFVFAAGETLRQDGGPWSLQLLLIWGCIPVGIALATGLVWLLNRVLLRGRGAGGLDPGFASLLVGLSALSSCGVMAVHTAEDPPAALYFPLHDAFAR